MGRNRSRYLCPDCHRDVAGSSGSVMGVVFLYSHYKPDTKEWCSRGMLTRGEAREAIFHADGSG